MRLVAILLLVLFLLTACQNSKLLVRPEDGGAVAGLVEMGPWYIWEIEGPWHVYHVLLAKDDTVILHCYNSYVISRTKKEEDRLLVRREDIYHRPNETNKMLEQEGITNVRIINESEFAKNFEKTVPAVKEVSQEAISVAETQSLLVKELTAPVEKELRTALDEKQTHQKNNSDRTG